MKKYLILNGNPKENYKNLCYIETQVNLIEGKGLISASLPGYYVHYMNSYKKNFFELWQ